MATPIKSFSIEGVEGIVSEAGLPGFRASQILSWLYEKSASSYDEMTNLPLAVRSQLKQAYPLYKPQVVDRSESSDGSIKYLLKLYDGAFVETVGLPSEDGRLTTCCSTQSGCAMGCSFCATGMLGFTRNLGPGEMVDQVSVVQDDFGKRVTNVVMMGQGEPFLNYEATLSALRIMNNPKLLNIGARHITVSTCGVFEGIRRFSEEREQFTLAISLHSALQETRDYLIPSMRNQPLGDLRDLLKRYTEKTGRRFSFEYALMAGINDDEAHKDALVSYCRHLLCHVNLIPLNKVKESGFKPVERQVMLEWKESLEAVGIEATVRRSRGGDIAAACGQLSSNYKNS